MQSLAMMAPGPMEASELGAPTCTLHDPLDDDEERLPRRDTGGPWSLLVSRMRARDPAAFDTVIGLTRDAGWKLAFQVTNDAHLAQDVLQESYLVVFTRLGSLRDPAAFRTWFLRIVLNQCRNAIRARHRETPVEQAPEATARGDVAETVARRDALERALGDLTPLERTAVLLRNYLQLSYQEMAEVLDVPLGTVKSRLNEARKQLLRRLKGADA